MNFYVLTRIFILDNDILQLTQDISIHIFSIALHDLDEKELSQCVSKFNRRLTKRFSTCHIDLPKENFSKGFQAHNCDEHPGYEHRCIR